MQGCGRFGHDDIESVPENAPTLMKPACEAQLTQHTDGQVQRNGQDNVSADGHQLTGEGIGQCADCTQNLNEHVEADDDPQRNEVALVDFSYFST